MSVVKLKTEARSPRPTKAAIAYLKSDPSRAPEFDQKYGVGASAVHLHGTVELAELMRTMVRGQTELLERIEELIDAVMAPKQTIMDQDGNVVGAVPIPNVRLNEDTNEWECTRCGKRQSDCECDDRAGGGELLGA